MAEFSYYYGSDAEQFNFFRLPKKLIQDPQFSSLSSEAKILYGMLLDRMTLSARNGWVDKENRIYIIYTVKEVEEEFNCCTRKAISLLAELDSKKGIGLIEKKRQGLGKPNILYVKNFNSVSEDMRREQPKQIKKEKEQVQKEKVSSKGAIKVAGESVVNSDVQECAYPDMQERAYPDVQERACLDVQERAYPDVQECACPDMQEHACLNNKTNNNKLNYSYTNPSIHPSREESVKVEGGRKDKKHLLRLFEEKLEYRILILDNPHKKAIIGEIFKLLADAYSGNQMQNIGGSLLPIADIRERFDELSLEHIRYVLQTLEKNTTQIKNIRSYLLTCLYNAPVTISNFYRAEVNHTYGTP